MSELSKIGWATEGVNDNPTQRFWITAESEAAFENLQKKRLTAFTAPEVSNAITLNHLHLMSRDSVRESLAEHRLMLCHHIAILNQAPTEKRKQKVGAKLLLRLHKTELTLLDELLADDADGPAAN